MTKIPRDPLPDSTLALLADPYGFIGKRCRRFDSTVFETRLLLRKTLCLSGQTAAELFYDARHFQRQDAAPLRLQKSLFGRHGVQTLDGEHHRMRKAMFLALMSRPRIEALCTLTHEELMNAATRWSHQKRTALYGEFQEVLTRAVCRWAGVPLTAAEIPLRRRQLTAMFDGAGALGPRHWQARRSRRGGEAWIREWVQRLRRGELSADSGTVLRHIATHRDLQGELLPPQLAAVEVLNVLRPTVAVAVYLVFIAHALHEHPQERERLLASSGAYREMFVHEVRRFYPFFPAAPAVVRETFEWRGYRFDAGRRVMLDLHGINHDPSVWQDPAVFRPERFADWSGSAYDFVPQGGGDHRLHHRCPGEWITIELMRSTLNFLLHEIDYDVPAQDLRLRYRRLPALPRSRFVIRNVKIRERETRLARRVSY